MPYSTNNDLPESVRKNLPEHAQTIFRDAFNNAHKEYGNEEQAFKVAWGAVKQKYEKSAEGTWVIKK